MTIAHPDDEALSAHLDDLAPEVAAHVAACASCRARLHAMRQVVQAVAAPPPPPAPGLVDRAVAAALEATASAAWEADDDEHLATEAPPPVPRPVPSYAGQPAPFRRRPSPAWLAVAAAVIAVLVAVPALLRDGTSGDRLATSPGSAGNGPAGDSAGTAAMETASAPVIGPDLGDQSDPAVMASLISEATAPPMTGSVAEAHRGRATPAAPTTVPGGAAAPRTAMAVVPPQCVAEAAAVGKGRLGALVYVAPVRWKGTPATVLVFVLEDGRHSRQAYVMSVEGCALLAEQRF